MTPEILAWIVKAEADWRTAQRELAAEDLPNFDAVCFHAQQCCEKYLKATLIHEEIDFRHTHDLLYLLDRLRPVRPGWEFLAASLSELTAFAVATRYPGIDATADHARRSIEHCRVVRKTVRKGLDLKDVDSPSQ